MTEERAAQIAEKKFRRTYFSTWTVSFVDDIPDRGPQGEPLPSSMGICFLEGRRILIYRSIIGNDRNFLDVLSHEFTHATLPEEVEHGTRFLERHADVRQWLSDTLAEEDEK